MNSKEWEMAFCENVTALRKKNNLSKREMSRRIGIGIKTLTLLERGIIPPKLSVSIVFMLQRAFEGIEVKYLFTSGYIR